MDQTCSGNEFFEIEIEMVPAPPGTKATPRPPGRPRKLIVEDDALPTEPPHQVPERTTDADS